MTDDHWFIGLLFLAFVAANSWIAYNVGKQSTLTKVEKVLEEQESVSTDHISLEDIKLEVTKLR